MTSDGAPLRFPVDADSMIAAIGQHAQRLTLPAWPVFGLVDADGAGWLCGATESQDELCAVRIDYRVPGTGPRLIVQSQPTAQRAPNLGRVLDQLQDSDDDGAPLDLFGDATESDGLLGSSQHVEVVIDANAVPATTVKRGTSTVWCVNVKGDVTVLIAAKDTSIEQVTLDRVLDLKPLQQRRLSIVQQVLATQPSPPPPYGC